MRAPGYEHEGAIDLRLRSSKKPSFLIGEVFLAEKQAKKIAIAWDEKYCPFKATQRVPPEIRHHYDWREFLRLGPAARLQHDECPNMFVDLVGKGPGNEFLRVYKIVKEALLNPNPNPNQKSK